MKPCPICGKPRSKDDWDFSPDECNRKRTEMRLKEDEELRVALDLMAKRAAAIREDRLKFEQAREKARRAGWIR